MSALIAADRKGNSVSQLPPAFAEALVTPTEGFSPGMALRSPGLVGFLRAEQQPLLLCGGGRQPVPPGTADALLCTGRFSAGSTNREKQKLEPGSPTDPAGSRRVPAEQGGGSLQAPRALQQDLMPPRELDVQKHVHPQLSQAGSPSTAHPGWDETPSQGNSGMRAAWTSSPAGSPQPNARGMGGTAHPTASPMAPARTLPQVLLVEPLASALGEGPIREARLPHEGLPGAQVHGRAVAGARRGAGAAVLGAASGTRRKRQLKAKGERLPGVA